MGLTLIEAAKDENRLARLPFMNIAGSGLFYSAEQELPSVGFGAVNEGYTQSYGVVARPGHLARHGTPQRGGRPWSLSA